MRKKATGCSNILLFPPAISDGEGRYPHYQNMIELSGFAQNFDDPIQRIWPCRSMLVMFAAPEKQDQAQFMQQQAASSAAPPPLLTPHRPTWRRRLTAYSRKHAEEETADP